MRAQSSNKPILIGGEGGINNAPVSDDTDFTDPDPIFGEFEESEDYGEGDEVFGDESDSCDDDDILGLRSSLCKKENEVPYNDSNDVFADYSNDDAASNDPCDYNGDILGLRNNPGCKKEAEVPNDVFADYSNDDAASNDPCDYNGDILGLRNNPGCKKEAEVPNDVFADYSNDDAGSNDPCDDNGDILGLRNNPGCKKETEINDSDDENGDILGLRNNPGDSEYDVFSYYDGETSDVFDNYSTGDGGESDTFDDYNYNYPDGPVNSDSDDDSFIDYTNNEVLGLRDDELVELVQLGVVAWGVGCGSAGVPSVYSSVISARCWLDQVMSCNQPGHRDTGDSGAEDVVTSDSFI